MAEDVALTRAVKKIYSDLEFELALTEAKRYWSFNHKRQWHEGSADYSLQAEPAEIVGVVHEIGKFDVTIYCRMTFARGTSDSGSAGWCKLRYHDFGTAYEPNKRLFLDVTIYDPEAVAEKMVIDSMAAHAISDRNFLHIRCVLDKAESDVDAIETDIQKGRETLSRGIRVITGTTRFDIPGAPQFARPVLKEY